MQKKETSRRGSLAISALLNDDIIEPLKPSSDDLSPILSSGTVSPVMGGGANSHLSKAKRKRISPAQYNRLMEIFDQTDTPSSEIRENLAHELEMTKREVQVWFQNRRAKMNRTKNLNSTSTKHRHSLIPQSVSNNQLYHHIKHRRASAYQVSDHYKHTQLSNGHYPIAPMPTLPPHPPQLPQHYYHRHQSKPSAIDLLASAAEYVRSDPKQMPYSKT
ncbi:hypothetical protein MFLAVUS_008182 [Mucor flavus]|uniref:Homeobox domain-containing protein n=1 Tax=Mucor flavus TaxID=439312 RepID=A0ABP9Z6F5_9FUNG